MQRHESETRLQAAFHGIRLPETSVAAGGKSDKLLDDQLSDEKKAAIARSLEEAQKRIRERLNPNGG